jgi:outer membrane protein assembly factor BamB
VPDEREPGDPPSVQWTYETDGDVWSSPVVADGRLFIGSTDENLYALDADSGDKQWQFETAHRVEGTPAIHDGRVYFGSYDRTVYALDGDTGREVWHHETEGVIRSSPTVVGNRVYIGVGCVNLACQAHTEEELAESGWIYCLDRETGDLVWDQTLGNEVVSTPAVADGSVYIGSSDARLYALDATTGDEDWTYDMGDWIWASPAIGGGSVFVADFDSVVAAVDARTGEERWTYDTFGAYISGSAGVDDEVVYIGATPSNAPQSGERDNATVFALDRETGAERWTVEMAALETGSSPAVTDETVFIGSHAPQPDRGTGLYAIDTDGQQRWFFDVDGLGVGASPALVDGTLYAGAINGTVFALA